jgi:hypothetical protein
MWKVKGTSITSNRRIDFAPETVLYAYDGPKTFTCRDSVGDLYLAHWCDEDADAARFLVVAFSENLLRDLTTGEINIRDALSRPRAWIVDLNDDWEVAECWRVNVDELPASILPKAGVMLWAHLQPRVKRTSTRAFASETVVSVYLGNAIRPVRVA